MRMTGVHNNRVHVHLTQPEFGSRSSKSVQRAGLSRLGSRQVASQYQQHEKQVQPEELTPASFPRPLCDARVRDRESAHTLVVAAGIEPCQLRSVKEERKE